MLGLDRSVLRTAWTILLFAVALVTIYSIRRTLVLFALALFLAHLLSPVVERVHWLIPPSGSRGPAIAIVYLVLTGILVALAIPIGSKIAEQAVGLATRLPSSIQADPLGHLPLPAWLEGYRGEFDQFVRERMQQFEQNVIPLLSSMGEQVLSGLGSIISVILIPILSFYCLKDAVAMRRALVASVDPDSRELVDGILMDLHLVLAQYMRALLLLAIATFVSFSTAFSILGVPYAVLLAGVAAALEVIPVIGPLTAAALILMVGMFSGYPHMLWLVVFIVIYRMFQDYILSPFLMSAGVEVHPLLVLLGVLAGEQIAGVPGMFFSVPLIAALRVVLIRVRKHYRETEQTTFE